MLRLDHIAVSGETLAEATAAVENALGVQMQPGGQHGVFSTHNTLLGLENGLYLEAIAIDPAAPTPERPRWFDLDRFTGTARLTNWICATDDMTSTLAELPADVGTPMALARGELRWQMVVPDTGTLPFDNLQPALLRWQSPVHPSALLTASGCALRRLIVSHPDAEALRGRLLPMMDDRSVVYENGEPGLRAEIDTPHGPRVLQ